MMKYCLQLVLATGLALSAVASGTYNARPPRVPAADERAKIDRDKYALGQKIYSGKLKITAEPAAAEQAAQSKRLSVLQARLPEKARRDINLTTLSGRLTAPQLEALEYYVTHRYPSK